MSARPWERKENEEGEWERERERGGAMQKTRKNSWCIEKRRASRCLRGQTGIISSTVNVSDRACKGMICEERNREWQCVIVCARVWRNKHYPSSSHIIRKSSHILNTNHTHSVYLSISLHLHMVREPLKINYTPIVCETVKDSTIPLNVPCMHAT